MKSKHLKQYGLICICLMGISLIGYNVGHASVQAGFSTEWTSPDLLDGSRSNTDSGCLTGGCGAVSCSFKGALVIMGKGVEAEVSVQCSDGYFACCGLHGASCVGSGNC